MEKLFWKDPYLKECNAKVVEINDGKVVLDRTIAYAFSGGQESDKGSIGGFEIIEAKKVKDIIEYTLNNHNLKINDEVLIKIDWGRRYRLMRLHFLGDLILQMILKRHPEVERVGAHVSENKVRIDFIMDFNIRELFDDLMEELNEIIEKDYPIELGFKDELNEIRYWKMQDYTEKCGGTHVKSTKELGSVKFKRDKIGKGKERIEILFDE